MSVSFSWSKAGDSAAQSAPKPAVDAKQTVPIADQLQRVHDAWNPQSPACAFQHYFYNRVPAEQAQQYAMPPGQDPQRWERAMIARPDPASVPVLAVGFTDLEKRINLQNQQVNAYRVRMHEINDKLTELSNRHDLHTTVKLLEMRERHHRLAKRALELAIRIQVLSNRGHVLTPQEELFQRRVRELIQKADDPAVFGSLNEAWARVKAFKERQSASESAERGANLQSASSKGGPGSSDDKTGASTLDWETNGAQLELIVKVLAAQQKGITFLAQLIENDTQLVDEDLGLVPRKPKQKALPVTAVAPQSFAAQIPSSHALAQQQLQQQQQQSGGLLGSNTLTSNTMGSNAFGANNLGNTLGSNASNTNTLNTNTLNTNTLGNTGTSLFGSSQTQPAATGGLFGQSKPAGSSLFGSSTATSTQPAPASGGLFGQSAQPQQSSGLFGQKPATGGLFGSQTSTTQPAQPSGGLFGQSAQNQQQPQQQQTGGLFGQKPAQTSGGLFGQQQPAQPSGGLFGQPAQQQQTAQQPQQQQSGGLFGQPAQQTQPASGGLFGQNTQASAQPSGGLFGQTNTQSSGGLFGQAKPFGSTGGGLFGK